MNSKHIPLPGFLVGRPQTQFGATIVEFSIAVTVFFVIIFSTLELARYMAIRGLATKAAQVALAYSLKTEALHLDLRLCESANAADRSFCLANLEAYRQARTRLNEAASAIVTSAFVAPAGTGGAAEMTSFIHDTPYSVERGVRLPVAFLRPGEQAVTDDLANEYVRHPTMAYGSIPPLTADPTVSSWAAIQERNPYVVQVQVRVSPILPWPIIQNTFTISAAASGYPETPKTTHIPPGLGLPMPPLAHTTTTSTTTTTVGGTTTSTVCSGSCTPPQIYDTNSCQCVAGCAGGQVVCDGQCWDACGGGAARIDGNCGNCDCGSYEYCIDICVPACAPGEERRGDCSCQCPAGTVSCDGSCRSNTCAGGEIFDPTPGVCSCVPSGCQGSCPAGQDFDGSCNCVWTNPPACDYGNINPATCACECLPQDELCDGVCRTRCGSRQVRDGPCGNCICAMTEDECTSRGAYWAFDSTLCLCHKEVGGSEDWPPLI